MTEASGKYLPKPRAFQSLGPGPTNSLERMVVGRLNVRAVKALLLSEIWFLGQAQMRRIN